MTAFLPYGQHCIDDDDIAAVEAVLRCPYLTTGPAVAAFERALAEAVNAPDAVACSSGTAALHLAAMSVGLGPGDAAIVPAITFLATANAVRLAGAEVVFADVDPDAGLMGAEHMAAAIGAADDLRVRAVFPVHFAGQPAPMDEIAALAQEHDLAIVEDACHALGSTYETGDGARARVGQAEHGGLAAFSFHPVKTVAMGEGGALTGRNVTLLERARRLRNHGMTRETAAFTEHVLTSDTDGAANPWHYEMPEPGLNYRASDIHCALGLSQLGNSGTGKTHIALGLGLAACQKGLSVGFITAAALVHELIEARDDKQLLRFQKKLATYKLLIVDELGFVPLSKTGAELLFEVFSQRYERGSTLVTTNLPFDEWTEVFGSERLTGALLDRLTHHVNILEMNGDSYRLNQSRRRQTPTAN